MMAVEAQRGSFSVLTCKPMFQSHQNPALQANLQATMRGQPLPQQGRQRPVKQQPPWHTCTCSTAVRGAAQMLEATTDECRACWCSRPCLAILKAALAAAVAKPCLWLCLPGGLPAFVASAPSTPTTGAAAWRTSCCASTSSCSSAGHIKGICAWAACAPGCRCIALASPFRADSLGPCRGYRRCLRPGSIRESMQRQHNCRFGAAAHQLPLLQACHMEQLLQLLCSTGAWQHLSAAVWHVSMVLQRHTQIHRW